MKTTTKQGLVAATWLLILFGVIGGTLLWQRQVRRPKQQIATVTVGSTTRIPTILLLDHQTTTQQRRQFVAGLQRNSGNQSVVILQVTRHGTLKFSGRFQTYDTRPILHLELPTNASAMQQAAWLKIALQQAQQQLKFKSFNLITYGTGGLAATAYLEQAPTAQRPQHLVAIGTPFNGTSTQKNANITGPVKRANQTNRLESLIAKQLTIDPQLRVLLIAGQTKGHSNGDGVVPVQSALAGQTIYRPIVKHYQQAVLNTWRASHTGMYDSWKLVNLIQTFIN
ncbi:alpha/beta hydrolase [Lactiplantibacillus sp. WILCCON 0030]|uniref:Alpha/beta hydrolase n=1 Tax=Lactiplantibacillus brownii TaxID=3069269 RepID=A0ABU1ABV4_9LACO|nr:alpha/beta hydrolase [Lactiplantibacillus brownii]MDQ7938427.1 alpha/beta hydrolase [Lactiplantibacillus brownii]